MGQEETNLVVFFPSIFYSSIVKTRFPTGFIWISLLTVVNENVRHGHKKILNDTFNDTSCIKNSTLEHGLYFMSIAVIYSYLLDMIIVSVCVSVLTSISRQ